MAVSAWAEILFSGSAKTMRIAKIGTMTIALLIAPKRYHPATSWFSGPISGSIGRRVRRRLPRAGSAFGCIDPHRIGLTALTPVAPSGRWRLTGSGHHRPRAIRGRPGRHTDRSGSSHVPPRPASGPHIHSHH